MAQEEYGRSKYQSKAYSHNPHTGRRGKKRPKKYSNNKQPKNRRNVKGRWNYRNRSLNESSRRAAAARRKKIHSKPPKTGSLNVSSVSRTASRTGKTVVKSPYTATKPYVAPKKPPAKPKPFVRPPKRAWRNPGITALEHYQFQNSFNFGSDATGTSLDAVIDDTRYMGDPRQAGEYDEYGNYIDSQTGPKTLNLGLTAAEFEALFDASSVEKYSPDGTVYYDVNMDLPNTQGFRQIQVRIAEV